MPTEPRPRWNKFVNVRLSPEQYQQIAARARDEQTSMSAVLRRAARHLLSQSDEAAR